jgi:histidinol-phosphate phosphatase family protein
MARPKGRAVFLDRDGTIILDHGYLNEARQVCLLEGAGESLAKIRARGFTLILVSNQSGIGRGLITREQAEQVHQAFVERLAEYGVRLDAVFYCPHSPADACRCRKPSPEPFLQAARELDLDLARSFMVGDQATDMEAGKRAGCRTILLSTVAGDSVPAAAPATAESLPYQKPDAVARDWTEVVRHLLLSREEMA